MTNQSDIILDDQQYKGLKIPQGYTYLNRSAHLFQNVPSIYTCMGDIDFVSFVMIILHPKAIRYWNNFYMYMYKWLHTYRIMYAYVYWSQHTNIFMLLSVSVYFYVMLFVYNYAQNQNHIVLSCVLYFSMLFCIILVILLHVMFHKDISSIYNPVYTKLQNKKIVEQITEQIKLHNFSKQDVERWHFNSRTKFTIYQYDVIKFCILTGTIDVYFQIPYFKKMREFFADFH